MLTPRQIQDEAEAHDIALRTLRRDFRELDG